MLRLLGSRPSVHATVAILALAISMGRPALAQQAAPEPSATRLLPPPPIAEARPHELSAHGRTRIDPYYWLRDDTRSKPEDTTRARR